MSKGTVGFPVSSFATLVKTQKKRYLEHYDLIPHTTLLQYEKTLAYNITLQILLSSVLSRLSSSPDRLVFSEHCHITLSYSVLPNPFIASNYPC